jgi:hypothetical protein
MGLFDDIFAPVNKALKQQPVAPSSGASSGPSGQGPSQADVDAQWRKDNGVADPAAGDLIDKLHPTGSN